LYFDSLQGEPEKAENFLMDAMKSFHQEGWHNLADDMKLELAKCQKMLGNRLKYPNLINEQISNFHMLSKIEYQHKYRVFLFHLFKFSLYDSYFVIVLNNFTYLKTACQVVSSPTLATELRQTFQTEIVAIAKECAGLRFSTNHNTFFLSC
jgi:hypothetical protein